MLDLGQLRSFADVAERGTVAAAAAALGFTPPAVSQHVAKLEARLGVQLFDRSDRRLRLTTAGARLLPIALDMIDLESAARAAVAPPDERPHFVVAGFASALSSLVIPQLPTARSLMTLNLIEQEDAEALRDLRLGIVDLVLTQEYDGLPVQRDARLTFQPVVTDQLRLVMPSTFDPRTTVTEFATERWLINGHGTRCAAATARLLQTAGIVPDISATIADNDALLSLVAAGHGVTIVPELLLNQKRSGLAVAAQDLGVSRTIYAVHRKGAVASVQPLVDVLVDGYQPPDD